MRETPNPNTAIRELVDSMDGHFAVTTEMSTYLLDMNSRTLLRLTDRADAADLRRDGQAVDLLRVDYCMLGQPAVWIIDLHIPHIPYTTRWSTPVTSIRRLVSHGHN